MILILATCLRSSFIGIFAVLLTAHTGGSRTWNMTRLISINTICIVLVCLSVTLAHGYDPCSAHFNASGSVSLPYPKPPKSNPNTTNHYVLSENVSLSEHGDSFESWFLDDANGTSIAGSRFDFQWRFIYLDRYKRKQPNTADGTAYFNDASKYSCQTVLGLECSQSIVAAVNSSVHKLSSDNASPEKFDSVMNVTKDPPRYCENKWDGSWVESMSWLHGSIAQQQEAANQQLLNTDTPSANSSVRNPANTTSGKDCRDLFSQNMTDKLVKPSQLDPDPVTPVIIAAWNNASDNDGKPWTNVTLVCMQPRSSISKLNGATSSMSSWVGRLGWQMVVLTSVLIWIFT